ncbi:MAG: DNA mismatch repair protein MutS [Gammaproteobacteria bacterium]
MQADLKPLEFEAVRRVLERLTSTPYGADAARGLEPAPSIDVALSMQQAVSTARSLLDAGRQPVIGQLPDIRAALRQASSPGATLNSQAMYNLQVVMRAGAQLAEQLAGTDAGAIYPGNLDELRPPAALTELLDNTLMGAGTLRDDASPELSELFAQRGTLREQVETVVRKRMASADIKDLFEDPNKVSWHNERGVIMVNSGNADKVKGVRRGTAMGGRDVVVEPMESVPANNQLETVVGKISAEQQKVLRAITSTIREHVDALQKLLSAITWIDLALACGEMSRALNAHAPKLVDEARVELRDAYHPLLLMQFADGSGPQPVPLSIELDGKDSILVITGPNTGGKTVALKTLGLLTVMAHCGLHIPAEQDCVIGNYRKVIVDVGDAQSLFHHLSTFAGHVEVLKRILDEAGEDTLVLLDELGTGTDPEEGAALAMAVLDELTHRRVQGIVNTHLSPLKEYAAERPGIRNASMQFDHERLSPTYRLLIGAPGVSLGLTIAEKNGLPKDLVARAREHLETICATGRCD